MPTIADRTTLIDLWYRDQPGHIATCVLETDGGLALVDPGPSTTLERLRASLRELGAGLNDVRILLITHIHLDHSGAAGVLAAERADLRVFVHERGAPHLIDPAKLVRSATMLYGDRMEELWGEIRPVPEDRVTLLAGGERLRFGSRTVRVAYTPGHAWHHVSYFDEGTGLAFTGDVLGEQPPGTTRAIPVTPPPDIDVEEMVASEERILAWRPDRLFVTHFGPVEHPASYAAEHRDRLLRWSAIVRASLEQDGTDEELSGQFADLVGPDLTAGLPEEAAEWILRETQLTSWLGLARYWRKRLERG